MDNQIVPFFRLISSQDPFPLQNVLSFLSMLELFFKLRLVSHRFNSLVRNNPLKRYSFQSGVHPSQMLSFFEYEELKLYNDFQVKKLKSNQLLKLKKLVLSYCVGSELFPSVMDIISRSSKLTTISIVDVSKIEDSQICKLWEMNLENIVIGKLPSNHKMFITGMRNNQSIKGLGLYHSDLDHVQWSDSLSSVGSQFSKITVWNCVNIYHIMRGLSKNNNVKTLSLFSIQEENENWMEYINKLLRNSRQLRELTLNDIGLNDEKLKLLYEGLLKNETLETLNLCSNSGIREASSNFFIHYLENSPPLKVLKLWNEDEKMEIENSVWIRKLVNACKSCVTLVEVQIVPQFVSFSDPITGSNTTMNLRQAVDRILQNHRLRKGRKRKREEVSPTKKVPRSTAKRRKISIEEQVKFLRRASGIQNDDMRIVSTLKMCSGKTDEALKVLCGETSKFRPWKDEEDGMIRSFQMEELRKERSDIEIEDRIDFLEMSKYKPIFDDEEEDDFSDLFGK